jgi:hypothetical protein
MTATRTGAFASERATEVSRSETWLRVTAVIFAVALVVHGADHLRRGLGVVTGEVLGAGAIQQVGAAVALILVFRRHRLAPAAAVIVGFASALGFTAAHLLPYWSVFSDPFTGGTVAQNVNAFSWFAALFEITADIAFGVAGLQLLLAQRRTRAAG